LRADAACFGHGVRDCFRGTYRWVH
jgi:hypothetical protein